MSKYFSIKVTNLFIMRTSKYCLTSFLELSKRYLLGSTFSYVLQSRCLIKWLKYVFCNNIKLPCNNLTSSPIFISLCSTNIPLKIWIYKMTEQLKITALHSALPCSARLNQTFIALKRIKPVNKKLGRYSLSQAKCTGPFGL